MMISLFHFHWTLTRKFFSFHQCERIVPQARVARMCSIHHQRSDWWLYQRNAIKGKYLYRGIFPKTSTDSSEWKELLPPSQNWCLPPLQEGARVRAPSLLQVPLHPAPLVFGHWEIPHARARHFRLALVWNRSTLVGKHLRRRNARSSSQGLHRHASLMDNLERAERKSF